MRYIVLKNTILFPLIIGAVLILISCASNDKKVAKNTTALEDTKGDSTIVVGANQTDKYLQYLKGKNVGIVANQTSVIFKDDRENQHVHLVDSLLSLNINIVKTFAPEHGFRGTADAGEHITDGIDTETGLPIISLYGENRKPSANHLKDIDIMIFDIQDVGVRFYTYISTLHYIMEACADANIPLLIFDRPNPNAHYIDGPILEPEYKSFVGMHPVPIVHALTIGEYAKMINGENWLEKGMQCDITVIPVANYTHNTSYSLPIKPSPNLPNDKAISLYPSLCLFEGTDVSIGRGTDKQFQIAGSPYLNNLKQFYFEFTPHPNKGAKYPKHQDKVCYGYDFRNHKANYSLDLFNLKSFYEAYKSYAPDKPFFNNFFTNLAGTKKLQQQIEEGLTEDQIKATWQDGLEAYKVIRNKYLIYE